MENRENKDLRIYDFNLMMCEKYKTVDCYSSHEQNGYGPIISGVYLKSNTFTGKIPYRVKARFIFNKDPMKSNENIREICRQEFQKQGTNFIINEDNTVRIYGIYYFWCSERICFNKFKTNTRFFGNNIVKEMYIHQDVLKNKCLYFEFNWISTKDFTETKELMKNYKKALKLY